MSKTNNSQDSQDSQDVVVVLSVTETEFELREMLADAVLEVVPAIRGSVDEETFRQKEEAMYLLHDFYVWWQKFLAKRQSKTYTA